MFERLAPPGGARGWGSVTFAKGRIAVAELADGCEGDLRHQLESALVQANADLGVNADAGSEVGSRSAEGERDARMTEAFKAFAGGR